MLAEFINRMANLARAEPEISVLAEKRSLLDNFALLIATCGIGFVPIVPATFGSLIGIGIYLLAQNANEILTNWLSAQNLSAPLTEAVRISLTVLLLAGLFLIGIRAADRVVRLTGKKDPRIVIIDEIVGQLITFLFVPAKIGWWFIIAGFLAFRFFDIFKIYPTKQFEELPAGLGVMADDVMAGFYAAVSMALLWMFCLYF